MVAHGIAVRIAVALHAALPGQVPIKDVHALIHDAKIIVPDGFGRLEQARGLASECRVALDIEHVAVSQQSPMQFGYHGQRGDGCHLRHTPVSRPE